MKFLQPAFLAVLLFQPFSAARAQGDLQDRLVIAQLNDFLHRWSQGPEIRRSDVDELYAAQVEYYGHELSRDGVIREKRSIARRWPERRYHIVPSSIRYHCTPDRALCTVRGVLRWSVANGAGQHGSGASNLTLQLAKNGAGYRIIAESGAAARGRRIE